DTREVARVDLSPPRRKSEVLNAFLPWGLPRSWGLAATGLSAPAVLLARGRSKTRLRAQCGPRLTSQRHRDAIRTGAAVLRTVEFIVETHAGRTSGHRLPIPTRARP